jgi:hypothetical protein
MRSKFTQQGASAVLMRHRPQLLRASQFCAVMTLAGQPAGVRLLNALNFQRQQRFKYLKSVRGGITAWSQEIDSNVPRSWVFVAIPTRAFV